jgi:peptidyl-dipeptidase A
MIRATLLAAAVAAAMPTLAAAPPPSPPVASQAPRPTAAEARAFLGQVEVDLKRLLVRQQTAAWIQATYITDDTEANAAAMNEDLLAYLSSATRAAARFAEVEADPDTRRMLHLLVVGQTLPAPSDPARRTELATINSRLEGIYGKGKWCGADGKKACRDLGQLEEVLKKSRRWDELVDAWAGWHTISREMRPLFTRLVTLGNEGVRELGVADLGELWRAGYDMTPAEFEADTDRLWGEVKPLYDQLHCYVRAALQKRYGKERVRDGQPIPAQLLGNMWAQEWGNLYPDLVPYPGQPGLSRRRAGARCGWSSWERPSSPRWGSSRCRRASGSAPSSSSRATARWSATPAPGT